MKRFLAIGLLVCAACGSSSHPTSAPVTTTVPVAITTTVTKVTTTTVKPTDYKGQYLALAAPVNAAIDKVNKADPTKDVPDDVLQGALTSMASFDSAVLRVRWPANTVADVKAMVRADGAFMADLAQANNQTTASVDAYRSQFARDAQAEGSAANIVRADLGLPANS